MAAIVNDAEVGAPENSFDHLLVASSCEDRRTLTMTQAYAGTASRLKRGVVSVLAASMVLAVTIAVITMSARHSHDTTTTRKNSFPVPPMEMYEINDAEDTVGGAEDVAHDVNNQFQEANGVAKDIQKTGLIVKDGQKHLKNLGHGMTNAWGWFKSKSQGTLAQVKSTPAKNSTALKNVKTTASLSLNDAFCAHDEEKHLNLCYKKCSSLTDNKFPVRSSAFSCCQSVPCGFFNQKLSFKICGGFDVSGDSIGGGCPHKLGSCLDNEELHFGLCYKRCSILTGFQYPYRKGGATCCTEESKIGCMNPKNRMTRKEFALGGGQIGGYTLPHSPVTAGNNFDQPEEHRKK